MNDLNQFHNDAMELAEEAFFAEKENNIENALALFKRAYQFELKAARLLHNNFENEPTRSVLFRSAANLALRAGLLREAEQTASMGLIGEPPETIAEELRNIFEASNFRRHMHLKGIQLDGSSFQLSMSGKGIYPGAAPSGLVIDRLTSIENIIYRTIERKEKQNYRKGRKSSFQFSYPIFFEAFRERSFALTVRIGTPLQPLLPNLGEQDIPNIVIQELFDCIELFNNKEEGELITRISDEAYYNNFVSLISSIAPDGEDISLIGFTSLVHNHERQIPLTLNKSEAIKYIKPIEKNNIDSDSFEIVQVQGTIKFADELNPTGPGIIKLRTDSNMKYSIIVPEGMDDIVTQLWSQAVTVTGKLISKNNIHLINIEKK